MQHFPTVSRLFSLGVLTVTLSACALLIPENPSAPRYNTVLGAPRAPKLNPAGGAVGSEYMPPRPVQGAARNPGAPVAQMPVPSKAESERAAAVAAVESIATAPVAPRERDIVAMDVPPPAAAAPAQAVRQVPVENQQTIQIAANYPDLHSVPPAPPIGPEGDAVRMGNVRVQLEQDRSAADAARVKLSVDAAAEPSLIGTPVPAPVKPAPAAVPVPMPSVAPAPVLVKPVSIAPRRDGGAPASAVPTPAPAPQSLAIPPADRGVIIQAELPAPAVKAAAVPVPPAPTAMRPPADRGVIAQLPPPPPPLAMPSPVSSPLAVSVSVTQPSAGAAANAPAVVARVSAPVPPAPMEPIVLRAPQAEIVASPVPPAPAPMAGFGMAPAPEPITLRAPSTLASNAAYLPKSRYADRRASN